MGQNTTATFLVVGAALGAQVVVGDLHDISAMRRAMRDVTGAYFLYPLAEGLVDAITILPRRLDVQNDVVRQIGGAPPKSLEAFVAQNRAAFGGKSTGQRHQS